MTVVHVLGGVSLVVVVAVSSVVRAGLGAHVGEGAAAAGDEDVVLPLQMPAGDEGLPARGKQKAPPERGLLR